MPLSSITYRNATFDDIGPILRLWQESGATPGSTDNINALRLRLRTDADLFVLAHSGDRLIGCVMGGWDGWRANMYRLVIDPGFRRQGIASELVRIVEERLVKRGAIRVYALAVREELDPGATAFWRSIGFEINPRIVPYVKTLGPS